jgi:hypothetical protein
MMKPKEQTILGLLLFLRNPLQVFFPEYQIRKEFIIQMIVIFGKY